MVTVPVNDGDERRNQRGCAGRSSNVGEDPLGKTVGIPFRRRSCERGWVRGKGGPFHSGAEI